MALTQQPAPSTQLGWIVPLYRTREFVEPFCARAVAVSQALGLSCEIVMVDDACPDDSGSAAEALRDSYPLRVLRLPQNLGQDAAVRAGLRSCTSDWAVVLDGDLQDPPEALAALWPLRAQGYDAVFADRFGRYESRMRLATSRLYRRSAELLGRLPRGAGLYVLLNRRVIDVVAATQSRRISVLAAIASARGRYASVRIERAPRSLGRSSYSAWRRASKGARSLWQIVAGRWLRLRL